MVMVKPARGPSPRLPTCSVWVSVFRISSRRFHPSSAFPRLSVHDRLMGRSFIRELRIRCRAVDAPRPLANAPLALQSVARGLEEDPFGFLIQVRRKLPPAAADLPVRAARFGRADLPREAFVSWFRDEPERARTILSSSEVEWGTFT